MGVRVSVWRAASDGCYDAARAAALSGVPKSTIYWWARHGVVVPSVSPVQEKLWSYSDLMALRVVSWLRHSKPSDDETLALPASPMPQVRKALALVDALGLDPWSEDDTSPLLVDRVGKIYVRAGEDIMNLHRQPVLQLPSDVLDLTAPFESAGASGPNLLRPRPHLRIVPSRVAGEPHIECSRLTTQTVAALASRGFDAEQIAGMYDQPVGAINEAIDLEAQLKSIAA